MSTADRRLVARARGPIAQAVAMTPSEVDRWLPAAPGWRRVGKTLVRDLRLRDFDAALALVDRVGRHAVDYERRPDICITESNHVRLKVFNLHHSGLTEAELRLALKTSAIIEAAVDDALGEVAGAAREL
jgi:pterin-4a-carbinolamine dehydratase